MTTDIVLLIAFFFVGLVLSEYIQLISDRGSFIESIWGRSKCDSCQKEIPWYALIPLVGRFLSQGKCPNCGKKISWKYFWFELFFAAGWLLILVLLSSRFIVSPLLLVLALLAYCTTVLLMYEDLKRYSVPLAWLLTWLVVYGVFWYLLGSHALHLMDTVIMVSVLLVSLVVVALRKPAEERNFSKLFGLADAITLLFFSLFLGFQTTTWVLLLTVVNAILFLILQKRLKVGQRLPLLTVMLPWGLLALVLL